MKSDIKIPAWFEAFVYGQLPQSFVRLMSRYFRLKVENAKFLPKRGAALLIPNHSGFAGLDAMILAHTVRQETGRTPRVLTHFAWFLSKVTAGPARKLGFVEATFDNGIRALRKNQSVIVFPEGELGNFKSTSKAYELQEFKRGFVRMALQTGAPIIPTLIVGAEESQINFKPLKLGGRFRNLILPLPLFFLLPSKWRIVFLEPIYLPYPSSSADDQELVREIADEIRENMQSAMHVQLSKRTSIYF